MISKSIKIFLSAITVFSIGLSFLAFNSVNTFAQSNRPSPLTKDVSNVAVNLTSTLTVFFEYGSLNNTKNISGIAAKATIINAADSSKQAPFEFVANNNSPETTNYDIFDGDPARADDAAKPRQAFPCDVFDGPRYALPESLFQTSKMDRYGLQTAKVNAQSTSVLTKGSTGCIALKLRVSANAKIGDQALVQFDWDSSASPDLLAEERPNILIQPLTVVAGAQSSSSAVVSSAPVSSVKSSLIPVSSSSVAQITPVSRSGGLGDSIVIIVSVVSIIGFIYLITRKSSPKES